MSPSRLRSAAAGALIAWSAASFLAAAEEPSSALDAAGTVESAARPGTVKDLIDRAGQWVVAIEVDRARDLPSPGRSIFPGFQRRGRSPETEAYRKRPSGYASGVLLDGDGNVLTSLYNVAGTLTAIRITLPDGRTVPARLAGKSQYDDLALLKIERKDGDPPLPSSSPRWADPSSLRAGRIVLALGRSPDPARVTVTRGIVSAAARNGGRAIQTDAELNYGNTGGPLIDLEGRIAAIATFIGHNQLQWGFNSGVGFGTTAATVREILPRLLEGKDFDPPLPPFLGVQKDPEAPDIDGAKVHKVIDGSGAGLAGIRAGDLIFEMEGASLHSFDHLRRLIHARKPGETVKLKVRRGNDVLEVEPRLGRMSEQ